MGVVKCSSGYQHGLWIDVDYYTDDYTYNAYHKGEYVARSSDLVLLDEEIKAFADKLRKKKKK